MEFHFSINLDEEYVRQRRRELGVKGRCVMPKNYYHDEQMLSWLQNHPMLKGIRLVGRVKYDTPRWAHYTMG